MGQFTVSICIAVALFCFVEGATKSDLLGAIPRNGAAVRREGILRIRQASGAALAPPVPPTKRTCVLNQSRPAITDLNNDVTAAENALRLDAQTKTPEELAPLTVPELDAQVKKQIQDAVNANLQNHIDAIAQC